MKTIVLTGATSMIGLAIINECLSKNIKVFALARKNSSKICRIPQSPLVRLIECDLDELSHFDENLILSKITSDCGNDLNNQDNPVNPIGKIDVFFHIGWAFTDKERRNNCVFQYKNVEYTLDAIHLAKRLGCKKFIGAGSQAEYGKAQTKLNGETPVNPEIAYGIAKYAAGKMAALECEKLELDFNWVRILSVYGKNDSDATLVKTLIHAMKENQALPLSPCTHTWDFLSDKDAGRAFILIAEKGISGKTYTLGSGDGRPLKDYVEIIKSIVNPKYEPNYGGLQYNEKSVMYLCADIKELTADTGFKPEIPFKEGIMNTVPTPPHQSVL